MPSCRNPRAHSGSADGARVLRGKLCARGSPSSRGTQKLEASKGHHGGPVRRGGRNGSPRHGLRVLEPGCESSRRHVEGGKVGGHDLQQGHGEAGSLNQELGVGTEVCQRAPAGVTGSAPPKGHQVATSVTERSQLGRSNYQKHQARRRLRYFALLPPCP